MPPDQRVDTVVKVSSDTLTCTLYALSATPIQEVVTHLVFHSQSYTPCSSSSSRFDRICRWSRRRIMARLIAGDTKINDFVPFNKECVILKPYSQ